MTTILIDDDSFALKLLGKQLALAGCDNVSLYTNARDALTRMALVDHGVNLVFCDLQMPDIDGVEFVRNLARLGYRGGLVLISGQGARILHTVQMLARAHHINILGAVSKPILVEQLTQILISALRLMDNSSDYPAARAPRVFTADELKRAMEGGQLTNYYQPKVSLATGAVVGAEALVRWRHPQAGMVYPDHFIPLAEDHHLIDQLTSEVLASALRQARHWHDAGLDIQMAVNVSMDNLATLDFPDKVETLLHEAGLTASNLVLEVTESRLMLDPRASLDILTRLRLKGIDLSIDDFGTGHSSLAQLRDIPFDELKLDQGFIHGACRNSALKAIVEGTLTIAEHLGIKSVAEGVEDQADWDFVRKLGCNAAQGYFIARPMPGDELPAWCDSWQRRVSELISDTP